MARGPRAGYAGKAEHQRRRRRELPSVCLGPDPAGPIVDGTGSFGGTSFQYVSTMAARAVLRAPVSAIKPGCSYGYLHVSNSFLFTFNASLMPALTGVKMCRWIRVCGHGVFE